MAPQEVILSTSSSTPFPYASTSSSTSSSQSSGKRTGFAPPAFFSNAARSSSASATQLASSSSITLHDLQSATVLQTYKPSVSGLNGLGYVQSREGLGGGGIFAAQEGKGMLSFWAWQKQQVLHRIHLPEKLTCFTVSPDGIWAVGGSSTGHIYLWEIASGLLLASFDAAYRRLTVLRFTPDSSLLLIGSEDSSITVYSIAKLVDNESSNTIPSPYTVLSDHTLTITDLQVGKGKSVDCRVWSTSLDGTVKVWALNPPCLLTSFTLPVSQIPTCLAVDPLERYFYVGSSTGAVHKVQLYRRRREMGMAGRSEEGEEESAADHSLGEQVVAVGGAGLGGESVKIGENEEVHGKINLDSPITCLSLSLSQSHLITGTSSGHIYVHSIPSHQLVRTIVTHVGSPISFLSTLFKPIDIAAGLSESISLGNHVTGAGSLNGTGKGGEGWPIMDVRHFERMRVGKQGREEQEIGVLLQPNQEVDSKEIQELDALDVADQEAESSTAAFLGGSRMMGVNSDATQRLSALEEEVAVLQTQLKRAKQINGQMWTGIVDKVFADGSGAGAKKQKKEVSTTITVASNSNSVGYNEEEEEEDDDDIQMIE